MSNINYSPLLGDDTGRKLTERNGYLDYRFGPAGTCEIVNIEVDLAYRGQGIGTKLLKRLEEMPEAKVIYAFTTICNIPAHNWYVKQGFHMTLVPYFYPDRAALIAVKHLHKEEKDGPLPPARENTN